MKLEKLIDRNASEALPIDELKNLSFEDQAKLIEYVFTFSSITHFFKDQIDPELIQYTPFYTIFDLNSSNLSSYQPFSFVENEKNGLLNMTNSNIFSNALLNVRDYLDILNKKNSLNIKILLLVAVILKQISLNLYHIPKNKHRFILIA